MVAYDLFVRPLSAEEKSRYYEDSKTLANLFEIPKTVLPESLSEFSAYFDEMLSGNTLAVGRAARSSRTSRSCSWSICCPSTERRL
jgi:uncharacterized protein (DUF2236 family)